MSGGPRRPPVPGLIPLAALSRRPGRPRRRIESPIDAGGAGSRCLESRATAAPGRRRHHHHHHHHRRRRATAVGKQSRSSSPALDRPPRVNPIFVWVRQENTHIVDVKCEDYDKRNRILLTKTAHGWRAIPRTEMLAAPRASPEEESTQTQQETSSRAVSPTSHGHHHRHHHKRKSRKSKSHHSTQSVQFPDSDTAQEPSWVTSERVNIESLLPSHTIQVKRIPSSEDLTKNINNIGPEQQKFARRIPECSTPDKLCDVSPLENLLAVAELELKQHMQSGDWNSDPEEHNKETQPVTTENGNEIDDLLKSKTDDGRDDFINTSEKSQECSYNDDDEMSMNDILSRLEQSLQSPHGFGSESAFDDEMLDDNCKFSLSEESSKPISTDHNETICTADDNLEVKDEYRDNNNCTDLVDDSKSMIDSSVMKIDEESQNHSMESTGGNCTKVYEFSEHKKEFIQNEMNEDSCDIDKQEPEPLDDTVNNSIEETGEKPSVNYFEEKQIEELSSNDAQTVLLNNEVAEAESSTVNEEPTTIVEEDLPDSDTAVCLDLSIKNKPVLTVDTDCVPTDLSIRKPNSSPKMQPPRPASQNSEAIQSPQPSGIPAVPASPDIVSTSTAISKHRSVFLESLLAISQNKATPVVSDTLTKAKEPLDLGHCRKSASPTVTCSQEIITPCIDSEPPLKKMKSDDITLKNLLDKDIEIIENSDTKKPVPKEAVLPDTPRLLSLLKASSDTQDPLEEYKQLLLEIDIPNPLMVPKDVFPDLLKHPRREILKILSGHSHKNVTLDDILVVYKDKLLAAIKSHCTPKKHCDNTKNSSKLTTSRIVEQNNNLHEKNNNPETSNKGKNIEGVGKHTTFSPDNKTSLANDIDVANEAALNPLFWTGCPNPFEAMGGNYQNHNDFIQALYAASTLPYFPNQLGEIHPSLQMMLGNKMAAPLGFPPFPPLGFANPIEMSMWQEAMMQASILKNKNPYETPSLNQQRASMQNVQKKSHSAQQSKYNSKLSNGHAKNISPPQQSTQQPSIVHPAFSQAQLNVNQSSWQNPYLNLSNYPQGTMNLTSDAAQFNPFSHKNSINTGSNRSSQQQHSPSALQKKKEGLLLQQYNDQEKRLHHQMMQEHQKIQQLQQQKLLRQHQQQQQQQLYHQQQSTIAMQSDGAKLSSSVNKKNNHYSGEKSSIEVQKHIPMDLSGAHIQSKTRSTGKSNGMVSSSRNLIDDVPEVGSTTGGIEDIQDGHAQLWHPLFGSQNKGYSPWGLPSLAAIGE